jgi:hypothetical protein
VAVPGHSNAGCALNARRLPGVADVSGIAAPGDERTPSDRVRVGKNLVTGLAFKVAHQAVERNVTVYLTVAVIKIRVTAHLLG